MGTTKGNPAFRLWSSPFHLGQKVSVHETDVSLQDVEDFSAGGPGVFLMGSGVCIAFLSLSSTLCAETSHSYKAYCALNLSAPMYVP
jgi:hypothetical protein